MDYQSEASHNSKCVPIKKTELIQLCTCQNNRIIRMRIYIDDKKTLLHSHLRSFQQLPDIRNVQISYIMLECT